MLQTAHFLTKTSKDGSSTKKSNWRGIRSKLKSDKPLIARNKAGIPGIGTGGAQSAALENFMRNMDSTVLNSNWHIL
jgi:hypothetical protein